MNSRSTFLKNITYLISGTGLSHLVLLAASPILTRIYDPSSFGVLAVFMSILALLNSIGALGLEKSIPYIKSKREYNLIMAFCEVMLVGIAIILSIAVLVTPESLYKSINIDKIHSYRYLLPIGFLLVSRFNLFNLVGVRFSLFKELSKVRIIQSISCVIIQIISGLTVFSTIGLIIGHIFGQFFGTQFISKKSKQKLNIKNISIVWKLKFSLLRKHYRYLSYGLFQSILNGVGQNIVMIMVAHFYGGVEAGLYLLAKQTIQKPQGLVGNAIKNVFTAKINEKHMTENKVFSHTLKLTLVLFGIGLLPVIIVSLFAPDIFSLVFGKEWVKAGNITQYIVWWIFFGLLNIPAQTLVPKLNLQKSFFIYEFLLTIGRLVLIGKFANMLSFEDVMKYFSFLGIIFNFGFICYILLKVKRQSH